MRRETININFYALKLYASGGSVLIKAHVLFIPCVAEFIVALSIFKALKII